MTNIAVIPDVQTKEGVPTEHLKWIGKYLAHRKPDIIVCLGDFADMPSLSSYDKGKRSFEGRRYKKDIKAAHKAMDIMMAPLQAEFDHNKVRKASRHKQWWPRLVMLLGNHEHRITRATEVDPMLEGTISTYDLKYNEWGWEVHDFLEVVEIEGIAFSHYFTTGVMGRAAVSAQTIINKKHQSCIAGHLQGRMVAYGTKADGRTITAIIAGSAYLHDEDYLGHQGNRHWRGIVLLHEVQDGQFDEMFVSLNFLRKKYETK